MNGNNTTTRGNVDAALDAAESDDTRLGRLRDVLSDEAAAARYREEFGKGVGQFKTADLDSALAAAERDREERRQAAAPQRKRQAATGKRVSRLERLFSAPGAGKVRSSRPSTSRIPRGGGQGLARATSTARSMSPSAAVTTTSRRPGGIGWSSRRNGPFPASQARRGGTRAPVSTGPPIPAGRPGACRRRSRIAPAPWALAAEQPEPLASRNLVQRLFDWLRTQVEKLLRPSKRAVAAVSEVSVAADQPRLSALQERYRKQWPEHAADIHLPAGRRFLPPPEVEARAAIRRLGPSTRTSST